MNRLKVISVIGEALASEQAISIGQCSVSFSILTVVKFSGIVPYLFGFSMRSGFILTSYSSSAGYSGDSSYALQRFLKTVFEILPMRLFS